MKYIMDEFSLVFESPQNKTWTLFTSEWVDVASHLEENKLFVSKNHIQALGNSLYVSQVLKKTFGCAFIVGIWDMTQ